MANERLDDQTWQGKHLRLLAVTSSLADLGPHHLFAGTETQVDQ